MAYRNSLTGCIHALGSLYKAWNQSILTIIKVPAGKYYTVLTDGELEMRSPEDASFGDGAGITFRGSFNELKQFVNARLDQEELFAEHTEEKTPPVQPTEEATDLPS